VRDFVAAAFYTVPEVQVLFAFRDARQVYRAAHERLSATVRS